MNEIRYVPPEEAIVADASTHSFQLEVDGEEIGHAWIKYLSKPFPLYFFEHLGVDDEHRGKKYGAQLLEKANEFIKDRDKPGLLYNSIEDKDVYGMYERSGWKEIADNPGWFIYNPSGGITQELMQKAVQVVSYREWDK